MQCNKILGKNDTRVTPIKIVHSSGHLGKSSSAVTFANCSGWIPSVSGTYFLGDTLSPSLSLLLPEKLKLHNKMPEVTVKPEYFQLLDIRK